MSTSITVRRYLNKQDVRYATTEFAGSIEEMFSSGNEKISPVQIAKAIVLKDIRGMLMAVLPGPHILDIDAINRQLHRNLRQANIEDYQAVFSDCSPGILPPLGEAYGFETVIDDGLLDQDLVYFVSGNDRELVRISGYDFQLLHSNAWFGNTFSHITKDVRTEQAQPDAEKQEEAETVANLDIREQLEKMDQPPKLPGMAQKIIQVDTNPYAHGEELAKLIEHDPALCDQIIRYAQSASYVKDPSIATLRQAMSRGLNYDLVLNIALGISSIRTFQVTPHGPLGLHAYWRHATYSATLIHGLCTLLPRKHGVQTGKAILCGMIHNIGHLLMASQFPKEFARLNESISDAFSDTSISQIEHRLFGITHGEIGYWLAERWNMPTEICTTILHHHNMDYTGPYREYVYLVNLTDTMLAKHNIGDANDEQIDEVSFQRLGLTQQQINMVLEKTIKGRDGLDNLARLLVA